MPYARLDDACIGHEKVLALSDTAFRLWVSMIVYASHKKTDGRVPSAALATFGVRGNLKRALDELCRPCRDEVNPLLTMTTEGGYQLHDYTEHNLSRQRIDRAMDRDNARHVKARHGVSYGVSHGMTDPDSHGVIPSGNPSIHPSIQSTVAPSELSPPAPKLTKADRAPESPVQKLLLRYAELLATNTGVEKPEFNWPKAGTVFKRLLENHDEALVFSALERFMADKSEFCVEAAWTIGVLSARFNAYLSTAKAEPKRKPASATATGVQDDWSEFGSKAKVG